MERLARVKPDESRTVYDGKLIDVTLERWGEHEREIVEHPAPVAIVAVDARASSSGSSGSCASRRARSSSSCRPASASDGEEPLARAQRELREECGPHRRHVGELGAFWTTPGFCREHMIVFLAEGVEPGEAELDDDEEVEVVRTGRSRRSSERVGELEDAKTLAGLLLFLRQLRRGSYESARSCASASRRRSRPTSTASR